MPEIKNSDGPQHTELSNYEVLEPTRGMIEAMRLDLENTTVDANLSAAMEELKSILEHPQHPLYLLPASENLNRNLLDMRDEVEGDLLDFFVASEGFKGFAGMAPEKKKIIMSVTVKILDDIKTYERNAQDSALQILTTLVVDKSYDIYRDQVAQAMGLGDNPSGFTTILENMAEQLPEPKPTDPKNWTPKELEELRMTYEDMRRDQLILVDSVFNLSIINHKLKREHPTVFKDWKFTEKDRTAALKTIGSYMGRRLVYKRRLGIQKEEDQNAFIVALAASSSELVEEFLEEKFDFGSPKRLVKADAWITGKLGKGMDLLKVKATVGIPKFLERMPPDLRAQIIEGYSGARGMAGAALPPLSQVAGIISNSPMGYPFWRRIFAVNNPVTSVLMLIYVNRSDDKFKAAMTFASYMTASAGMGALMETWGSGAHQKLVWRGWFRRAGLQARMSGIPGSSKLARLMRLGPKHPALQFAIIMAVAIGGAEYIDKFISWIDEDVTSDSPEKEALKEQVNLLLGGSIVEGVGFIGTEIIAPATGLTNLVINPEEDALRYLGSSQLTIRFGEHYGTAAWRPTMQREQLNNISDWNTTIDLAIADEWNPVQQKIYALEKVDSGPWAERQSFHLFGLVEHAKSLQESIAQEMVDRKQIQSASRINLLDWATNDVSDQPNLQVVHQIEDIDNSTAKVRKYITSLSVKDESDKRLKTLWEDYRLYIDEIARRCSVYRHLGIYNREEWLGEDHQKLQITEKVQRGIASELRYLSSRDEALQFTEEGNEARGDFAKNLSSSSKTELEKTYFSNFILSSLFTKDGNIVHMRSHFYKRALIAGAEAAALGLPEHHDINVLFAELRRYIVDKREMSIDDVKRIRDRFTDAVREYSIAQEGNEYKRAPRTFTSGVPSLLPSRVFISRDIDQEAVADFKDINVPDNWPDIMLQKLFEDVLKKEQKGKRADIVLYQQVIPEWGPASKYKLAIHAMTCIECPGADPSKWVVHVHRHQTAPDVVGFHNDIETSGDKGISTKVPYLLWVHLHPDQAKQIQTETISISALWSKMPQAELQKEIEAAETRASVSTDEFISIPFSGEFRRKYAGAEIISRSPGSAPWFPDDLVKDRRPLEDGADFTFTVRRPGKADEEITITDRYISKINKMPAAKRSMIFDVLTTPFENADPSDEVARVMNVFFRSKYSPSDFSYTILGYKVEFYYQTLHAALIPLYQKADNKKYFLERLYQELDWRNDTIAKESTEHLTQWFANNMNLFDSKTTPKEVIWFDAGDRILGYPNINGVYIINKSKAENSSALQYAFFPGHGWLWRPNPDSPRNPHPKKWYSPHQENIPWKSINGKVQQISPLPENLEYVRKLQPYSKK